MSRRALLIVFLSWCSARAQAIALVQLRAEVVQERDQINPFAYITDRIRSASQRRRLSCSQTKMQSGTEENKSKKPRLRKLFPNSDFEQGNQLNWRAEGDAFLDQPTKGDNTHARGAERCNLQGDFWIGTFEAFTGLNKSAKAGASRGDAATGSLTSIPFTLEKRFIVFLVGGGGEHRGVGVRLFSIKGGSILMTTGTGSDKMERVSFDASIYIGQEIQIHIFDNAPGGEMGHINVDDFRQSDEVLGRQIWEEIPLDKADTFSMYEAVGYNQSLRPQFHFTSLRNWLNDPNGMLYHEGEYHLFFQHNANGIKEGPRSWGHAVSTDMVHWKQLPHAITPFGDGSIWSGSAVVDWKNHLGKQKGRNKTIVAFYTFANRGNFYQAAAFSMDRGRTFSHLRKGKPVVINQGISPEERDPKVFWHDDSQRYVMVLWLGGKPNTVRFFQSQNLVDWKKSSDYHVDSFAECPNMFELPVDGNADNKKWVLHDGSFRYIIGSFDGRKFNGETEARFGDLGPTLYASQSFNDAPNGSVISIGWLRSAPHVQSMFEKEGMPFNQQMSFPTNLTLRNTSRGLRLFRWPVSSIENLYLKSHELRRPSRDDIVDTFAALDAELLDLSIDLRLENAPQNGSMNLSLHGLTVTYRSDKAAFCYEGLEYSNCLNAEESMGKIQFRALVDRSSLELFVNRGEAVATFYADPSRENRCLELATTDDIHIELLIVHELSSSLPDLI